MALASPAKRLREQEQSNKPRVFRDRFDVRRSDRKWGEDRTRTDIVPAPVGAFLQEPPRRVHLADLADNGGCNVCLLELLRLLAQVISLSALNKFSEIDITCMMNSELAVWKQD
jgi:hypothetical protein